MKQHKIVVQTLLALFALGAGACLFSMAYAAARNHARQERLERESDFQKQAKEFLLLQERHAEWQRLPRELSRFRREQLISMEEFAAFRRDLNLCLDDNGLAAPDITLQFSPGLAQTRRVRMNFSLSGPYRSLKKFIYDMEQKPLLHFFEVIELTGSGAAVQGRFTLEAYLEE